MSTRLAAAMAIALIPTAPAWSQDVIALSPAERMAVLDAAAENAPINGVSTLGDGKVHGEMGVAVGSNGLRAIYGNTVVPLGDNATLGVGVFHAQGGFPRRR